MWKAGATLFVGPWANVLKSEVLMAAFCLTTVRMHVCVTFLPPVAKKSSKTRKIRNRHLTVSVWGGGRTVCWFTLWYQRGKRFEDFCKNPNLPVSFNWRSFLSWTFKTVRRRTKSCYGLRKYPPLSGVSQTFCKHWRLISMVRVSRQIYFAHHVICIDSLPSVQKLEWTYSTCLEGCF